MGPPCVSQVRSGDEAPRLPGRPIAIVDRLGRLRDVDDYRLDGKGDQTAPVFVNDLLEGSVALAVMEH